MKLRRQLASRSRNGELHKLSDGQALTSVFVNALRGSPSPFCEPQHAQDGRRQRQAPGCAQVSGRCRPGPASIPSCQECGQRRHPRSVCPTRQLRLHRRRLRRTSRRCRSCRRHRRRRPRHQHLDTYPAPLFNRVEEGASANPHQPKEPASAPNGVRVYVACTPRPGLDPQPPLCLA